MLYLRARAHMEYVAPCAPISSNEQLICAKTVAIVTVSNGHYHLDKHFDIN